MKILNTLTDIRKVFLCCSAAIAVAYAAPGQAAYPDKPINLIVGYGAGGSVDYIARKVAAGLEKQLGRQVVVQNFGGASGSIGAGKVVNAAPDGYTLLLGSGSEVAIAWQVNPALQYNGLKDLAPIALVATSPMVLLGNNKLSVNNLNELIAHSKSSSQGFTMATSGVGTPQDLLRAYINNAAGTKIENIPYRSAQSIFTDVISGRVDLSILTLSSALPYIASNQLKGFAVTGSKRSDALPNLPFLAENKDLAGANFGLWFGLLGPANLPKNIAEQLNKAVAEVTKDPALIADFKKQDLLIETGSVKDFTVFVKADADKYKSIIDKNNIRLN